MSYPPGNLTIEGPAGPIECLRREAEGRTSWAIVTHPHPLHGGTMHSKVVYRTARALEETGFNVLRFNFRGVGGSGGTHDGGPGEAEDLRAALDHLERERAARAVLLAGFSFGSWVNARVGPGDPRVPAILHVGLPASDFDLGFLRGCPKPAAVVQGDLDRFGKPAEVLEVVESMPAARLFPVEGADHFFTGKIAELDRALREAIAYLKASAGL